MSESCDQAKCSAHTETVSDVKAYKVLVIVFGSAISLLLMWLIGVAHKGEAEISNHKEVAMERYSKIELELSEFRGSVNITNNNLKHMQGDMTEMLEIIKGSNSVFAESPIDSSILMVKDFE